MRPESVDMWDSAKGAIRFAGLGWYDMLSLGYMAMQPPDRRLCGPSNVYSKAVPLGYNCFVWMWVSIILHGKGYGKGIILQG